MTLIVNLSTTHDYSIDETIAAFVKLCNQYDKGCLQSMPGFFQNTTNYAWVIIKYQTNYPSLIEPYKLGKINTEKFLEGLSKIFYFMNDMEKSTRDPLLVNAWNASIKLSEKTDDNFSLLVEKAKTEPVYLISNTNELNVQAILALFKQKYPNFSKNIDVSIKNSETPIQILPNIYLCLSYRYGAFKEETVSTVSLIEKLSQYRSGSVTLVSQYSGDLNKARQLGLDIVNAEEFYNFDRNDSALLKKST